MISTSSAESGNWKTVYRLTLGRGILAIAFGVLLFVQPETTQQFLANFMGLFWLAEGILTLRAVLSKRPIRRRGLYAGVTAIFFGVLLVTSGLSLKWLPSSLAFGIGGAIIVLTGLLYIFGGYRIDDPSREARVGRVLLGIIQVVLGFLIIASRFDFGPVVYLAMGIWAFVSGILLILAALRLRAQAQGSGRLA